MTKRCIHKMSPGNRPCDQPIVFLTAEQAQARGWRYSGWYHELYVQGAGLVLGDGEHHALPDAFRPVTTPPSFGGRAHLVSAELDAMRADARHYLSRRDH
jgi:hypothetical protein